MQSLGFRDLVFRMLVRALDAPISSATGPPSTRFQPLLRRAGGVRIVEQDLSWRDLRRTAPTRAPK